MSMLDEVRWDAALPADHPSGANRLFRTSSFGCPCFDHYVVTPEGRLFLVGNGWHDDLEFEDPQRTPVDVGFHGDIQMCSDDGRRSYLLNLADLGGSPGGAGLSLRGASAQCHLVFENLVFRINGGADPLVGVPPGPGRPRPALCPEESGACRHRRAGQGAGCGRGRPPHQLCRCPPVGKLSDIGLQPRRTATVLCEPQ